MQTPRSRGKGGGKHAGGQRRGQHGSHGSSSSSDEVIRATKRINAECAEKGDIRGARALLESLILGRGLQPTLVTANILIKTYRAGRNPEGAEAVLRELPAWGLTPDACTFSTLVDAYGLAGRVADAQRMASFAEAMCIVDSRVYSALVRFVPPEAVEPLMARMRERHVPYNTALCNAVLSTFATSGRAAEASAFMEQYMAADERTLGPARPPSRDSLTGSSSSSSLSSTSSVEAFVCS